MPGGAGTRPIDLGRVIRLFRPPAAPSAPPSIPSGVASAVGPLGVRLLQAAQHPPTAAPGPHPGAIRALQPRTGAPIPPDIRAPVERSFGYDLSPVRVHDGPHARRALAAMGAAAATLGDHVLLGAPVRSARRADRHVLAHELAHTVQGRLGRRGGGARVSQPTWPTEREAERAAAAALTGQRHEITEGADEDLHRVAPWVILAGLGLAAGVITWAVSDSPETNRKRHAAGAPDPSRDIWALVPIYGSIQQIREAETYFQRVLGVGFLMLDVATLGTAGVAARALIKAPAALLRTAFTRQGQKLVVAEGGEIVTKEVAQKTVAGFSKQGGAVFASKAAARKEIFEALNKGSMVIVTKGGTNHAMLYAKNGAGKIIRIHGGPLRVLHTTTSKELSKKGVKNIVSGLNSYVMVSPAKAAMTLEQAAAIVRQGSPAWLRWIRGSPTSCGIVQGALLDTMKLPKATLAKLLPSGAGGRILPITVMDHAMRSKAGLKLVDGGRARIIGGTLSQSFSLAGGAAGQAITPALLRVNVANWTTANNQLAGTTPGTRRRGGTALDSLAPASAEVQKKPVPQTWINSAVSMFVSALSDADASGHKRVVFSLRRTVDELWPGYEKSARGKPTRARGEQARRDVSALVRIAAMNPIGTYRIIATRTGSGWSLDFKTVPP